MSARVLLSAVVMIFVSACQGDTLEQGAPQLIVEAKPEPRQTRLIEPEGLALGDIPLSSIVQARFSLENRSTYTLTDLEAVIVEVTGGQLTINDLPTTMEGGEVGEALF